jgi:hypothetical protein
VALARQTTCAQGQQTDASTSSRIPAVAAPAGRQALRASAAFSGQLNDAAVTSGGTAWAVGYTTGEPLTERWNGKGCPFESALEVGSGDGDFYSVSAISASNAWAVGYAPYGSRGRSTAYPHQGAVFYAGRVN